MNTPDLYIYAKKLNDKKESVLNTIESMKVSDTDEARLTSKELSTYDNHPAEFATELYTMELDRALLVNKIDSLKEIERALKRIENGSFGKCPDCGREIDKERLDAIPYARLCIECENVRSDYHKTERVSPERPNEELVLDAPLGRKYLNQQEDDDEHEGMDYLNDLMKYGSADSPQDMGGYDDFEEFYTNKIDNQGIVDHMDNISNEEYKKQLPD